MMGEKKNLMQGIDEKSPWQDITPGGFVYGSGNSEYFNTGDWRTRAPVWKPDKCRQCLLCFPVCPDSSIPVKDGKRTDFDFGHCKGCAICAKVCPFGAIDVIAGTESPNENSTMNSIGSPNESKTIILGDNPDESKAMKLGGTPDESKAITLAGNPNESNTAEAADNAVNRSTQNPADKGGAK